MNTPVLDQFRLDSRVALITGVGSGIGEAIAQAMAEAGADVACVDIDEQRAQQIAAQVRSLGRKSVPIVADVTQEPDVVRMFAVAVEELGTVDIAFANAGAGFKTSPLVESTLEEWHSDIDLHLTGVYLTAREAARVMVPKRRGKIIATASIVGFRAGATADRGQWYAAAKAGVINLVRTLGVELAQYNIQVNAIAPTYTRTNIGDGALKEESGPYIEQIKARMPIHRLAEPHEYKGTAVFLACPASDLITGFTVAVDGGYLAW